MTIGRISTRQQSISNIINVPAGDYSVDVRPFSADAYRAQVKAPDTILGQKWAITDSSNYVIASGYLALPGTMPQPVYSSDATGIFGDDSNSGSSGDTIVISSGGYGGTYSVSNPQPPVDPPCEDKCKCQVPPKSGSGGSGGKGGNGGNGNSQGPGCSGKNCKTISAFPIRYSDGKIMEDIVDLASNAGGLHWEHRRSYDNIAYFPLEYRNGYRWKLDSIPVVHFFNTSASITDTNAINNESVQITYAMGQTVQFDRQGTVFVGHGKTNDTFVHNTTEGQYEVRRENGELWIFNDFSDSSTVRGALASITTANGTSLVIDYNSDKSPSKVIRTFMENNTTIREEIVYYYVNCPDNISRIQYALLRRSTDNGNTWTNIKRVKYEYYGNNDVNGSVGGLKCVISQYLNGQDWNDSEVQYYRYYKVGNGNTFNYALKYIVEPADYVRLAGAVSDPTTASDAVIAQYATKYFEYDGERRACREVVFGGTEEFNYSHSECEISDSMNTCATGTTETYADGSRKMIFTNTDGKLLLSVETESTNSDAPKVVHQYVYDEQGNLIQHNTPESIASCNAWTDWYSWYNVTLHSDKGLIERKEYYSNVAGQPDGYLHKENIRRGSQGTDILLREHEYVSRTATVNGTSRTVWFPSVVKEYPTETGMNPNVTQYAYTFFENSIQMEQRTTTLPAISVEKNGSGIAATRVERFDQSGRLIWTKDELGIISYNEYDPMLGVRVKSIQDVDTTKTNEFNTSVPTGWSTVTEAGRHLVSNFQYDAQGRIVQSLAPKNEAVNEQNQVNMTRRASWMVYDDVNHKTMTASGYVTLNSNDHIIAYTLVNPVSITLRDSSGNVLEQIQAARSNSAGKLLASDTFDQSSYVSWTKNIYDSIGRLVAVRQYHNIPTSGNGLKDTNYIETTYSYGLRNRQNRMMTSDGTITRNVFDWRGNVTQIWVGTNDTDATDSSPSGNGNATNNMVIVSETEYGGNTAGCSTCSGSRDKPRVQIQYVDDATTRVTEFGYDWRGRRTHVHYDEDANGNLTFDANTYDNLNRVTVSEHWLLGNAESSGSESSWSDGGSGNDPVNTTEDRLLARSEQFYNERNQVWKTEQSVVDPNSGTVRGKLLSQNWYDANGRTIKTIGAGEQYFTKNEHDSLGRVVKTYTGYDVDETSYAEAKTINGDTILQQMELSYDNMGNTLVTTSIQRKMSETGTGTLSLGTSPKGSYQISANWYDPLGRNIASANYGNNGESTFTRPNTVPTRSDTCLVSETYYDGMTGQAWRTIDPASKDHRTYFDDLGRTVKTIANYVNGTASSDHPDQDVMVEYTYHSSGQVSTLTAVNPTTGNQITRYVYGTQKTSIAPLIYRNDLLVAEIYPDSDDFEDISGNITGTGENGIDDRIEYQYNRIQGERVWKKDQNGTIHRYEYDNFGRILHDRITTLGTGVDGAVRRISTSYTLTGRVNSLTSWDNAIVGSGSIVNEVHYEYDMNGLLAKEYQNPSGAVNIDSLYIGYVYDATKNGDYFTNKLRPLSVFYPSGSVINYEYGNADSEDDLLNQIVSIRNGATTVVEYDYMGLNTPMYTGYPEPNVSLDYTTSDALDRFGRITDHAWKNSQGQDVVRIKHGYDRIGNRLYREDLVAKSLGKYFDELYSYDEMNQVTGMTRGTLNSAKTAIESGTTYAETFAFDSTGNWTGYNQDTNGDGTFELNQTRTHNAANELTAIGNSSTNITTDANGNMTKVPKPETWGSGYSLVYDGWNRLVEVIDSLTVNLIAQYEYNGLNHRVLKKTYTNGNLTETREFFFNGQWQCLEEYLIGTETPNIQYTWGQRYIDDLICRDRDATQTGTLNERLYSLTDPNWNVVALLSPSGTVLERYTYCVFGKPCIFTGDFATTRNSSAYNWTRTFTGQVLDNDTGIMLYRNRYYHPTLGRFVTRDSIGYVSHDFNIYRYNGNMANQFLDPKGLSSISPTPMQQDCINDCLSGCNDEFGWYNPQRYICRGYCDNTCTNTPDILDKLYNTVCPEVKKMANDKVFSCTCAISQILDFVPIIGEVPAINGVDLLCTAVTSLNMWCNAAESGNIWDSLKAGLMTPLVALDLIEDLGVWPGSSVWVGMANSVAQNILASPNFNPLDPQYACFCDD